MRTLIKLVLFLFFIRKSFRSHSLDFSAHFFSFLSLLSLAVLSRDFCIFADANGLSIPCRIYFFSLVPHDFQTVNIRFAHRSLTPPVHNLGHAGRRKMKQIAIPQRIGTLSAADDLIDFNSIRYYSHTHTHTVLLAFTKYFVCSLFIRFVRLVDGKHLAGKRIQPFLYKNVIVYLCFWTLISFCFNRAHILRHTIGRTF